MTKRVVKGLELHNREGRDDKIGPYCRFFPINRTKLCEAKGQQDDRELKKLEQVGAKTDLNTEEQNWL